MDRDQLLTRISIDPKICFGKPCVRGDRMVSQILDLLANGETVGQVLGAYPDLEEADVLACIAYGAEMAERCVCLRVRQMQTRRVRPL
jgi:uncharacterized protein (DUF433 family)